ncbi:MAG: 50S ribosomal protein L4 [Arenicellales bacterium]|jgi:large subunit ribosomal protein L4|nr:50S ribosomal protein L4 [Acidiferrobacteraceae bacterium]MDP6123277.1 50S ribosomal protein L4 [Arenicellales bacterium]MBT58242.1 50S ribosomal protein L4 [Acidiferrobacteraceae bacterium]MDP6290042.1 50S ribosomal protein L4 [Arenicellales bacterium]MDP6434005.1 50S ribosomal protein L4 [Arenicellales bacterium]|tara:strand:- start:8039 stop:8638 length:600 start_codon:yes stop_codon:yes gene_type:complete
MNGKSAGNAVNVSDDSFGADYKEALVHQVVVAYQAGGRSGTSAQKNRSAARGGGAKPWRQKGTGRARAGTIRSPLWRGGGRTFAASPRNYEQKVNKKMYQGAMRSIVSELLRQDRLIIIDKIEMDEPKTKKLLALVSPIGGSDALLVIENDDQNIQLAARNLPYIDVLNVMQLDPVSLVRHEKVMITEGALKAFEEVLS